MKKLHICDVSSKCYKHAPLLRDFIRFCMLEATDEQIKKALITITIEKILLEMGRPVLDTFTKKLYKNYNCYIPDCYDNPEYLSQVLKEMYGNSSKTLVCEIMKDLAEFSDQKPIANFIKIICN